jgi:hypothetical protein
MGHLGNEYTSQTDKASAPFIIKSTAIFTTLFYSTFFNSILSGTLFSTTFFHDVFVCTIFNFCLSQKSVRIKMLNLRKCHH